ncbi:MAG: DUF2782 domain-containing protein [Magnetococcus sp. DMHC-8]
MCPTFDCFVSPIPSRAKNGTPMVRPVAGQKPRGGWVTGWPAILLGMALLLAPGHGMTDETAPGSPSVAVDAEQPVQDEVTRNEAGFPVPRKGPMISELREDLGTDPVGPETVIRRYEDYKGNTVREFLINGRLFQIEVTPANGPTYYLIDVEGNGLFQERYASPRPRLVVPQWVLFRF